MKIKNSIIGGILASSFFVGANAFAADWKPSTIEKGGQELYGRLDFSPAHNEFMALKAPSQKGKVIFIFKREPLAETVGAIYGFFTDAIFILYPNDPKDYINSKPEPYELSDGTEGIVFKSKKYIYFAQPIDMSRSDTRIGTMIFWREAR